MQVPPGALPDSGALVPSRTPAPFPLPSETGEASLISSGSSKRHNHFCLCPTRGSMLPASAGGGQGERIGAGRGRNDKLTLTNLTGSVACGLLSFASAGLGVAREGMWAHHPHLPSEQPEGPPVRPPSPSTGSELLVPGFVSISGLERHRTHPRGLSGPLPEMWAELPLEWAGLPPRRWTGLLPGYGQSSLQGWGRVPGANGAGEAVRDGSSGSGWHPSNKGEGRCHGNLEEN